MGAFVGEKNLDVIKMHGTTIKKNLYIYVVIWQINNVQCFGNNICKTACIGF